MIYDGSNFTGSQNLTLRHLENDIWGTRSAPDETTQKASMEAPFIFLNQ